MTKEELKNMLDAYAAVSARYHKRMTEVENDNKSRLKDIECRRLRAMRNEFRDTILKEFESLIAGSLSFLSFRKKHVLL